MTDDLKGRMDRLAATYRAPNDPLGSTLRRASKRATARKIATIATAAVIAVVAIGGLILAFRPVARPATVVPPHPAPGSRGAVVIGRTTKIPGGAGITSDGSVLWVLGNGDVLRIDQASLGPPAKVKVPVGDIDSITVGDGMVWVTSTRARAVFGIDPVSLSVVVRIPAASREVPVQIAAGNGGLWSVAATGGRPHLIVLDPASSGPTSVIADIKLSAALGFTYCDGAAWVDDGKGLLRIDPAGGQTSFAWDSGHATITDLGGGRLACAGGRLWQIRGGGVVRLAAQDGAVRATASVAVPGEVPSALSGSSDSLWVMTDTGSKNRNLYYPNPSHPSLVVRIDALHPEVGASRPATVGLMPMWFTASGDRAWTLRGGRLQELRWRGGSLGGP